MKTTLVSVQEMDGAGNEGVDWLTFPIYLFESLLRPVKDVVVLESLGLEQVSKKPAKE
jgi:hypothetical protein